MSRCLAGYSDGEVNESADLGTAFFHAAHGHFALPTGSQASGAETPWWRQSCAPARRLVLASRSLG